MNHLKLLFALSVALNVGLVTLLALYIASSPKPRSQPVSAPVSSAANSSFEDDTEAASEENAQPAPPAVAQTYRRLFSALRATGLPEAEIHRILLGAALADWQQDIRQLRGEETEAPFWQTVSALDDIEFSRQVVEMGRARETALAEVIGDGVADFSGTLNLSQLPAGGGISPEVQRRVRMLEEDYALLMAEIQAQGDGVLLEEDQEALQLLRQERLDDLSSLLSGAELEDYELRHSNTAHLLRRELHLFNPDEEEFRAIFRIRHEMQTYLPNWSPHSTSPQHQSAEDAVNRALQDLLGEERFVDYRRATDPDFRRLAGLVRRLELPLASADRVYEMRTMVHEQSNAILTDAGLTGEERQEALQWLAEESGQLIRTVLGETGYAAYRRQSGEWLRQLETQAAQPPPASFVTDEERD